ncbi:serine/threonine protein kinase [Acidovorax sp. NCPPB 2350]|nr:serine/threonine protein kinase [Acidovorax sp. NCPPB 2350]
MRTPHATDPDTDPGIDPSEDPLAGLTRGDDINDRLNAEHDVSDGLDEISARPFDDPREGGPLNFDDGTDMGHPRGKTGRTGGTWAVEGGDSGDLDPPAEVLSDRNGPSDPDARRGR